MLSESYFGAFLYKRGYENIVDKNLEGARTCCAPLWIHHCDSARLVLNWWYGKNEGGVVVVQQMKPSPLIGHLETGMAWPMDIWSGCGRESASKRSFPYLTRYYGNKNPGWLHTSQEPMEKLLKFSIAHIFPVQIFHRSLARNGVCKNGFRCRIWCRIWWCQPICWKFWPS